MRLGQNVALPMLLTIMILMMLSVTLTRFTGKFIRPDTPLVGCWNFGAKAEDDAGDKFNDKNCVFRLFDRQKVGPMDFGKNSFTLTGGGSDLAIVYDVEMNLKDMLWLSKGTVAGEPDVDIHVPFVFRITTKINEGSGDRPPKVFVPNPDSKGIRLR